MMDVPEGTIWRSVKMSETLFQQLGAGIVDWGAPDAGGFYTPTIRRLAPTLDEAWARAEAALPEGADLDLYIERDGDVRYVAEAGRGDPPFAEIGSGPNPAAALIALAEKLEAR